MMNVCKSALLFVLISIRLSIAYNISYHDNIKYVVFNGESCNIAGDYGRACSEFSNNGVLEVVRESTGVYLVYFSAPFGDNNYVVLTTSNLQGTGGAFSSIGGNDDSLHIYFGVSKYFVRIDTRKLNEYSAYNINSDYISVVATHSVSGMVEVVFNGEDCPGNVCVPLFKSGVDQVQKYETGLYEVIFSSERPAAEYLVFASSNVWGTGGTITSIGGDASNVTTQSTMLISREIHSNTARNSDYVAMMAGIPTVSKYRYVTFDGADCSGSGGYGAACTVFQQNEVREVVRDSAGRYRIYWTSAFPNANYVVLCDSNPNGTGGTVCGLGGNNVGSSPDHGVSIYFVEVQTRKMGSWTYADSNYVSVMAFL